MVDIIPGLNLRIDKDFNRRMMANQNSDTESGETKNAAPGTSLPELMGTDGMISEESIRWTSMEFTGSLNPNDYGRK